MQQKDKRIGQRQPDACRMTGTESNEFYSGDIIAAVGFGHHSRVIPSVMSSIPVILESMEFPERLSSLLLSQKNKGWTAG